MDRKRVALDISIARSHLLRHQNAHTEPKAIRYRGEYVGSACICISLYTSAQYNDISIWFTRARDCFSHGIHQQFFQSDFYSHSVFHFLYSVVRPRFFSLSLSLVANAACGFICFCSTCEATCAMHISRIYL